MGKPMAAADGVPLGMSLALSATCSLPCSPAPPLPWPRAELRRHCVNPDCFFCLLAFVVIHLWMLFKEPLILLSCPSKCSNSSNMSQLTKRGISGKERLRRIQDRNPGSSRHWNGNIVAQNGSLPLDGFMTSPKSARVPSVCDLCFQLCSSVSSCRHQQMVRNGHPITSTMT